MSCWCSLGWKCYRTISEDIGFHQPTVRHTVFKEWISGPLLSSPGVVGQRDRLGAHKRSVSCLCRNRENLKQSKMLPMRHSIKKLNSWTLTIIFAFGAHLSVTSSVRPLAGWPGPVAVVGMPVGVVVAVVAVPLLVHGAVMMVMVMVVTTVLGPATVPLALLGRQITWLCGGAEVCAQAWQRDVSVYI